MKKIALSAMMCLVAMTTTAQVITSEIVNNAYLSAASVNDSKFAYNVECDDYDCITTMNVFNKTVLQNGDIELKPSCRYEYDYASDGMLLSRTKYVWQNEGWQCVGQLQFTLTDDLYTVEYSRWNQNTTSFDPANEMMTYTLMPDNTAYNVSCYLRNHNAKTYQLAWQVSVTGQPSFDPYLLATM